MLQNTKEFFQLLELYEALEPKRVLEIGAKNGGTLWYWLHYAAPKSVITVIDDCKQEDCSEDAAKWAKDCGVMLNFIKGDSHSFEVSNLLRNKKFDFVFIDGDHTYDGVKADWEMYGKAPVVVFHDIVPHEKEEDNGAAILWQEIKEDYACMEFVNDWLQGCYGIGIVLQ